jgi:hypothetical protein
MCNTYSYFTPTMAAEARLSVTVHVHCLSVFKKIWSNISYIPCSVCRVRTMVKTVLVLKMHLSTGRQVDRLALMMKYSNNEDVVLCYV